MRRPLHCCALEAVAFELDLPTKTIVSVESWGADEILESRGLEFDLQVAIGEDSPDGLIELLFDSSDFRQALGSTRAVELLCNALERRLQRRSLFSGDGIHHGGKEAAKGIRLENLRFLRDVANSGNQDKKR